MAALAESGLDSQLALDELAGALRYVARQPILDLHGRVHAYELLFRSGPEANFSGDGNVATRTMLDNAVLFGVEKLTSGLPAFVNCTQESLTEDLVHVLPPGKTVLEILETVEPTPELIEACRKLRATGFRLALDDFAWAPKFDSLVELVDYVKVDFLMTNAEERQRLLRRLSGLAVVLVAEKIETHEEYQRARAEGFTLFQGYYFCRPVLLENHKIPANRLSHLEVLRLIRSNDFDLRELTQLVKRDTSLTYRLLRLVNSPMCAQRQEVRSIQAALLAVGEEAFRRIATLAIASELNSDRPAEILRMVFVRGRFCELAAGLCALDATEQFLLGIMSLLPAMLRVPMEELTPALPLRDEIRAALLGRDVPERVLLQWLENHERSDWNSRETASRGSVLNEDAAGRCYAEAMMWAEDILRSAA